MTNSEKFWSRVCKDGPHLVSMADPCWVWVGNRLIHGYGKLTSIGLAHRFSYTIHHGEIPPNREVIHECDNPTCVNPSHLSVGTHQENISDMMEKDRHECNGEANWSSILTDNQIEYIRKRYKRYSHKDGCGAIARELGVATVTVWKVVKRITWKRGKHAASNS